MSYNSEFRKPKWGKECEKIQIVWEIPVNTDAVKAKFASCY